MGSSAIKSGLIFIALNLIGQAAMAGCQEDVLWIRGDWGKARFAVEVADDSSERALGLMNRESMPSSKGMLFVYDHPQSVSFWMKNTLIPLDIVFADATGVVQHVHANAVPGDLTPIPGGDDIQYVLEINGGLAEAMGIQSGSEIQHPQVSQKNSAWACE